VDPIPFTKSLRVAIEHLGWTYNPDGTARSGFEERSDFFSSVAFWYQKGVNEDLSEPPYGTARLPFRNALQIEVEDNLKDVTTEKGEVSVQKEAFWSKDLLFFKAEGPGAKMTIPFEAPKDGFYEVVAQIAQSKDYGNYMATLDGKQTNSTLMTWGPLQTQVPPPEIIHNYQPETFVGIDQRLGWFKLSKGRHLLALTCVGKDNLATGYNLGVDNVVLQEIENGEALADATGAGLPRYETVEAEVPARPPIAGVVYRGETLSYYLAQLRRASGRRRAEVIRVIGSFDEDAAPAVRDLIAPLSDRDPEVRSAAVWALGHVGPKASPAASAVAKLLKDEQLQVREFATVTLREMGKGAVVAVPDLIAALNDPAGTVRMSAALALGEMGTAASSAVPALTGLLEIPDQSQLTNEGVQVVRSATYALAQIGPDARSAIPALQKIYHLRIKYIAEEAIAKIEGRPTPTWH
jgi:HEAT repeat protein